MKCGQGIGAVLVCAALGIATLSGAPQKVKWKGKITEKDGLVTVSNPRLPLYAGPVLKLSEDLRIGDTEGRPDYTFGRISGIAVDNKGCIYVADDKNVQIKAFDAQGTYLRAIGRQGQGPGEIGSPYDVFVNSRGELLVPDGQNYKLHVYSPLGLALRDKSFGNRFPEQSVLGLNNELYVLGFGGDFDTGTYFEFAELDEDLNLIMVLHRVDIPPGPLRETLSGKIPLFCVRSDGCLVMGFGRTDEYRIQILDAKGRLTKVFTRDFDPVPIPKDLLDKAKKSQPSGMSIELPTHFPVFARLMADDEGRIFALTAPYSPESTSFSWDVFDKEGRYLASVRLPGSSWHMTNMKNALLWKAGKMYVVEEDEGGYHVVKRYRADWKWD
jgi:hypothetical protein